MIRWLGWSCLVVGVVGLVVPIALAWGPEKDWVETILLSTSRHWLRLILIGLGAGWVLARINR